MTTKQSLDTRSTDLAAGFDVLNVNGLTLRFMYSQTESDHTRTQAGSLKVSGTF